MHAEAPDAVPDGSVVIPFRHRDADGPIAIVIGTSHPPYFVFEDGRTEPTIPRNSSEADG